jgi:hypothetical protein
MKAMRKQTIKSNFFNTIQNPVIALAIKKQLAF